MEMQFSYPTTPDEFLSWQGGGDFRWEFVDGEAVRLPRDGTRRHTQIISHLHYFTFKQLEGQGMFVGASSFCVWTRSGIRRPDLVADVDAGRGDDLAATAPTFIAEVLSDWSYGRDFGSKRLDYFTIPSLRHYLVVSQLEPTVWLWTRQPDGEWRGPDVANGPDATFHLSAFDLSVPLSALYGGPGAGRMFEQ